MPKDYSKLLIELKDSLPNGYQSTIAESIDGVELWHVKWAFSKRPVRVELLKKIYKKAAAIVRKEQRQLARANAEVRAIKKTSRQTA